MIEMVITYKSCMKKICRKVTYVLAEGLNARIWQPAVSCLTVPGDVVRWRMQFVAKIENTAAQNQQHVMLSMANVSK